MTQRWQALKGMPLCLLFQTYRHQPRAWRELVLGGLLLEISVGSRGRTSRELVQRAETLAAAFERRPSLSIAQRAADEICRNYRLPFRINGLAEQLACDQTALRRQFHFEYGTDLRDYHLRARIQAAVRLMCADCPKIAAIATSVGYSSEKNFYRNTREITGHTPGELKRIGPNQLRTLADRLLPQRKVP